jgi:hypothetical protein
MVSLDDLTPRRIKITHKFIGHDFHTVIEIFNVMRDHGERERGRDRQTDRQTDRET